MRSLEVGKDAQTNIPQLAGHGCPSLPLHKQQTHRQEEHTLPIGENETKEQYYRRMAADLEMMLEVTRKDAQTLEDEDGPSSSQRDPARRDPSELLPPGGKN